MFLKPAFMHGAPQARQRGITLIESLVAMVVTAVALFGILGVQMRTLVDTQSGVRRAQAIRLIEDLGELMQSNPDALNNLSTYASTPVTVTNCASTACSPTQLAAYDIKNWADSVAQVLPAGQATVFSPKNGSRQLGVLIGWREGEYNLDGKARTVAEKNALNAPFQVSGTASDNSAVNCPAGLVCHIQYLQPTQRCTPWAVGGGTLYCPN